MSSYTSAVGDYVVCGSRLKLTGVGQLRLHLSRALNVTPYSLTALKSLAFNPYKIISFNYPDLCGKLQEPSLTARGSYQCRTKSVG